MTTFNPIDHPICFSYPLRVVPSSWMEHVPFAMFLIDVLKPRLFVELGTALGVSYCAFCQAVKEQSLNTRCYAVDTWEGDSQTGKYETKVLDELRKHHDPLYGSFSTLIQGTFDDALTHFNDGTIDLLHIDGFHTYDAVRHDFDSWLPKMSEEGVILFHDINVRGGDFGVWRLWEELKEQYVHFDFSHEHGLGMLVVGRQPAALEALLNLQADDSTRVRDFFYQLGLRLRHSVAKDEETHKLWTQLIEKEAEFARERAELEGFAHQLNDAKKEIKELSRQLTKRDNKINSLSVDLADKYRELQELTTRQMAMAQEALVSSRRIQDKEKSQQRLNATLTEQQQRNAELAEQLAEQQRQNAALTEEQLRNAELAHQLQVVKSEIENLTNQAGNREQLLHSVSLELADRNSQLNNINTSFGGRMLNRFGKVKYRYLLPVYRLMNLAPQTKRQNHNEPARTPSVTNQLESAPEDESEAGGEAVTSTMVPATASTAEPETDTPPESAASQIEPEIASPDGAKAEAVENVGASEIRLGIILPENDLPSGEELISLFSEFGNNHCLIQRDNQGDLKLLPRSDLAELTFDSLPITHLYEPDGWAQRLSNDHLRNALLSLKHTGVDFVIVSHSLANLPLVAISSLGNAMVFSKAWRSTFADSDLTAARAVGKVLRLVPPSHEVNEVQFGELIPGASVNYQADQGIIWLNQD